MHTWCLDSESQGEGKGPAKGRLLNGYCMFFFVHVDGLLFTQGTGEGFHSVSSSFIRVSSLSLFGRPMHGWIVEMKVMKEVKASS